MVDCQWRPQQFFQYRQYNHYSELIANIALTQDYLPANNWSFDDEPNSLALVSKKTKKKKEKSLWDEVYS